MVEELTQVVTLNMMGFFVFFLSCGMRDYCKHSYFILNAYI